MIEITETYVYNMSQAILAARNPLDSWDLSDSDLYSDEVRNLGENDLKLLRKLIKAGSDHRKFMRQILVSVDIDAPMYWWKEMSTYSVGVSANSCSTMHTLHKKEITLDMFSTDGMLDGHYDAFRDYVDYLELMRDEYIATKEKEVWRGLIQMLPMNFNQLRTVTLNYEVLLNIYFARKNHKLTEWHTFCEWIEELPYFKEMVLDE